MRGGHEVSLESWSWLMKVLEGGARFPNRLSDRWSGRPALFYFFVRVFRYLALWLILVRINVAGRNGAC